MHKGDHPQTSMQLFLFQYSVLWTLAAFIPWTFCCFNSDNLLSFACITSPCIVSWKLFQCIRWRQTWGSSVCFYLRGHYSHISGISSVIQTSVSYNHSGFLDCFREKSKSSPYYSILAGIRNTVLFCFVYIIMNSWFLHIWFALTHCSQFPFWCSKYPNLGQWELLHVGFWVLLTCSYQSL